MEPTNRHVFALLLVFFTLGLASCADLAFSAVTPTPLSTHDTPFGPMATYVSPTGDFVLDYPAWWSDAAGDDRRCGDAVKCLISRDSEFMLVRLGPLAPRGAAAAPTLEAYVDDIVANFESTTADAELVARDRLTTDSGLPGEVLTYRIENGLVTARELYVTDGEQVMALAFITWNEGYAAMAPIADYVFSSVRPAVAH